MRDTIKMEGCRFHVSDAALLDWIESNDVFIRRVYPNDPCWSVEVWIGSTIHYSVARTHLRDAIRAAMEKAA